MDSARALLLRIACGFAVVFLASCDSVSVHRMPDPTPGPGRGYGPPAHAKAHGYRHKQVCGYELVYDSGRGVYVVVGLPDCYYHEGHFYRLHAGVWEVSLQADADWAPVDYQVLPPGLRAETKDKTKTKGFAKGKH
jgi:hypothetical protein